VSIDLEVPVYKRMIADAIVPTLEDAARLRHP
jgi:hypothetical protein